MRAPVRQPGAGLGLGSPVDVTGRLGGGAVVGPTAGFTMSATALVYADRIYQRDTLTGGGQSVGQGAISVPISSATAGTINARCRASDGVTILQPEWAAATIANAATTASVAGVDARLGWFYLDLKGSDGTWQNGSLLIGMGDLHDLSGQSLAACMLQKLSGNGTIAAAGVTPNANTRVFSTYTSTTTWQPAIGSLVWELPADAGHYTSSGCAQYLNLFVARNGCNQGLIGHSVSGTALNYWMPAGTGGVQHAVVLAAAGGKWRYEIFYQGHEDSKNAVPASQYQADMAIRQTGLTALNSFAGTVNRVVGSIPNINVTGYGPTRLINAIRTAAKAWAAATPNTNYVDAESLSSQDGIHEDSNATGTVPLANNWYRAMIGGNVGPALVSATRSGTTITATLSNLGTDLTLTGAWYSRFVAFASGSTQTKWPISGGAKVNATTVTLTLANDPGDGTVIDLWMGPAYDGDGATNDPSGIMIRDDRTDADGITVGRTFQPSIVPTVVAAPVPAGTQNTPPGGVISASSYFDMTMTSAAYGAEVHTGFGTVLTAGYGASASTSLVSTFPMSIVARIIVPTTPTANVIIAGVESKVQLLLRTTGKVQATGIGASVIGATTLVVGHEYYIAGCIDANGIRVYIQDITAGTAGIRDGNSATVGQLYASTGTAHWLIGAGSSAGTSGFFANSTGGKIFDVSFWKTALYTGTGCTAPTAPLVGNETGLMANIKLNSDGKDAVRWA